LYTDSRPPANLKLAPDIFRFQVDGNNALQRTTLDVLANDAGEGLRITSFQTSDTYIGVLTLDRSNNRFTYGVAEFTGGSRTWWFDYTVVDSSGDTATARATVRVGECCVAGTTSEVAATTQMHSLVADASALPLHYTRTAH
jgi:hypothetical protein